VQSSSGGRDGSPHLFVGTGTCVVRTRLADAAAVVILRLR
jgi:hypothetical protein